MRSPVAGKGELRQVSKLPGSKLTPDRQGFGQIVIVRLASRPDTLSGA
jgi:hypothetical protein